jgi:hypothetical protein
MRIFVLPGANIVQRVGSRELQLTVSCSLQPEPSPLTDLLLAIGYWLLAIGYWQLAILYRLCASPAHRPNRMGFISTLPPSCNKLVQSVGPDTV